MEAHPLDEHGEHDEESCYQSSLGNDVKSECRCGACCHLLIEVLPQDADREPRIKDKGSPLYTPAELTASGEEELAGYVLNSRENGYACAFLDRATNLCTIYETRPLVCRLFDCDGEGREQLTELGILPREG
jgi:Fe-S-cluster containining protein